MRVFCYNRDMTVVIAILAGLLLGSFLSVLLDRWPHWRGVATGRSQCPQCRHELAWFDLMPLVSWLMLGGKCRYCHASITKLYLALELTMAGILGLHAFRFGVPSLWYAVDFVVLFALGSLFFFDLKHRVLPDVILLPLLIVATARLVTQRPDMLVSAFATGALLAGLLGLLYLVSHGRWLGLGDVKLAFIVGVLFGYPVAVGVTLIAIWSGALVGVGLILAKRANMQTALPFGSFWAAAAVIAIIVPGPIAFISGLFMPTL